MALTPDKYETLEAIVGSENISQEPALLDGYAYQILAELTKVSGGTRFMPYRPEAVLLPESTEEVQAVVKACNRLGIKFKAISTGWGPYNAPSCEGVVLMDMVRMNHILEISEKNMYAVVEPYVSWAQLQAELWKRGLNCMVIGAGCQCSALASVTSFMGLGTANFSMGYNARNALGVEWVLPTGDILRLGSLGSTGEWFCGDGPGPSLRGLMRGDRGAMGGLGVFTKCALKVYNWPGPVTMPIKGVGPNYVLSEELPDNTKIYMFIFDSKEQRDDAICKLGEAEIGYHQLNMGWGGMKMFMRAFDKYLPGHEEEDNIPQELTKGATIFSLVCNSPGEMQYQEKVLNAILTETGGRIYPLDENPVLKANVLRTLFRTDFMSTGTFHMAGGFWPILWGIFGGRRTMAIGEQWGVEAQKKLEEEGKLSKDGADGMWQPIFDFAHTGYLENELTYDPCAPESVDFYRRAMREQNEPLVKRNVVRPEIGTAKGNVRAGKLLSNFHIWQMRIKKAFDPNTASDPGYYMMPE
jgi:glycolate oxidase